MDIETRKALNKLARLQLKRRLLADIAVDLMVCKLEGWEYKEYIKDLINELERLI